MNTLARVRRLLRALGWGSWSRFRVVRRWRGNQQRACGGRALSYGGRFLNLREVVLQPERWGQAGFFQLPEVSGGPPLETEPVGRYFSLIREESETPAVYRSGLSVLIERTDWANPYFNLRDLYDAFLMARLTGYPPAQTSVYWLDDLPPSPYVGLWLRYFRTVGPVGELSVCRCQELVVGPNNEHSLLSNCLGPRPPWMEEFVDLLAAPAEPEFITLVSREGAQERILANRAPLVEALRSAGHPTRSVRMEDLGLEEQLRVAASSKALLGMHGAGLSWTLWLPPGSLLVEFFPDIYHAFRFTYRNLAGWRGLSYRPLLAPGNQAPVERVVTLLGQELNG